MVESGKQLLRAVEPIQRSLEFFQTVSRRRDEFLDLAEDYEPVQAFFQGEQREIFQRAVSGTRVCSSMSSFSTKAFLVM